MCSGAKVHIPFTLWRGEGHGVESSRQSGLIPRTEGTRSKLRLGRGGWLDSPRRNRGEG
jgi:hypothetical protein